MFKVSNSMTSGGDSGSPLYLMNSQNGCNQVQCLQGVVTHRIRATEDPFLRFHQSVPRNSNLCKIGAECFLLFKQIWPSESKRPLGKMYFKSVPHFYKWIMKTILDAYTKKGI